MTDDYMEKDYFDDIPQESGNGVGSALSEYRDEIAVTGATTALLGAGVATAEYGNEFLANPSVQDVLRSLGF